MSWIEFWKQLDKTAGDTIKKQLEHRGWTVHQEGGVWHAVPNWSSRSCRGYRSIRADSPSLLLELVERHEKPEHEEPAW